MKKMSIKAFRGKCIFKIKEKIDFKCFKNKRKSKLNNTNFTIISNNCYAGWVYRYFNLPYYTPTVGLFIMPDDYIKLLNNLEFYFKKCKLEFIKPEESKYFDYLSIHVDRFKTYPIGKLGDVELHFLHYKSEKEAYEKWTRRAKRMNWDNIIIKFDDQNGCTLKNLNDFANIKKYKKICFVAKEEEKIDDDFIYVKEFKKDTYMVDDTWFSNRYLNLIDFLNKDEKNDKN